MSMALTASIFSPVKAFKLDLLLSIMHVLYVLIKISKILSDNNCIFHTEDTLNIQGTEVLVDIMRKEVNK